MLANLWNILTVDVTTLPDGIITAILLALLGSTAVGFLVLLSWVGVSALGGLFALAALFIAGFMATVLSPLVEDAEFAVSLQNR